MADVNKGTHEEEAYRSEVREKYTHEYTAKSKKTTHGQFGIAVIVIFVISATIYGIFNYRGSASSSTASTIILPSIKEQPEEVGEDKVVLENLTKEFNDQSYLPQITFNLKFWNNTDKDIKGFEGLIMFSDIFDNEVQSVNLSYDEGLKSHYEVTIERAIDYNQFIDADRKLKEIENENLKHKWKVTTILYDDGTKKTY
jgi:hypothetical protein